MRALALSMVVLAALAVAVASGPYMGIPAPTVWPLPVSMTLGTATLRFDVKSITLNYTGSNEIVKGAIARFRSTVSALQLMYKVNQFPVPLSIPAPTASVATLSIYVVYDGDSTLELGADERYTISVDQTVDLKANTIWGALHALETLTQLVQWDGTQQFIQMTPICIYDNPRYPWRGLMLDTSRHFLPLSTVKGVVDAMAATKFNVFHWHLTDAEAFPWQVKSHPPLWQQGAYSARATYTSAQIADVITYAKNRGIRVMPEFDTPGHAFSWGLGVPDVILNCSQLIQYYNGAVRIPYPNINNACVDMTNGNTYTVVGDVLAEAADLFNDAYMHLGGDEVAFGCMDEFPRVKQWMHKNLGSTSYYDLVQYYTQNIMKVLGAKNKTAVFWQEAFSNIYTKPTKPSSLPPNTIFEVWMNQGRQPVIEQMLKANQHVILASAWYLAKQVPSINDTIYGQFQDTWQDFYSDDPEDGLTGLTPAQLKLILGGEVCQWGEQINKEAVWSLMWPRAAAAAERLWSPKDTNNANGSWLRFMAATCRLYQRGYGAAGIRPDYCEHEGDYDLE